MSLNHRYVIFRLAFLLKNRFGRCLFLNFTQMQSTRCDDGFHRIMFCICSYVVRQIRVRWVNIRWNCDATFQLDFRVPCVTTCSATIFPRNFSIRFPYLLSLAQLSWIYTICTNRLIFLSFFVRNKFNKYPTLLQAIRSCVWIITFLCAMS